jgi:hypothetical protein
VGVILLWVWVFPRESLNPILVALLLLLRCDALLCMRCCDACCECCCQNCPRIYEDRRIPSCLLLPGCCCCLPAAAAAACYRTSQ